jgi:hypothetical protein
MATISDLLIAAGIVFFLGTAAAAWLSPQAGCEEMDAKMVLHFLLGPICLGALILILTGMTDHLYLVRWL